MLDPKYRLRSHRELQREAIRRASTYAHFSQSQPFYSNKAVGTPFSAYEWAVADYFGKPKVLEIDIQQWTGEAGQTIRIQARDNLMVLRGNAVHSRGRRGYTKQNRIVCLDVHYPYADTTQAWGLAECCRLRPARQHGRKLSDCEITKNGPMHVITGITRILCSTHK
jgi:hypothetical protein